MINIYGHRDAFSYRRVRRNNAQIKRENTSDVRCTVDVTNTAKFVIGAMVTNVIMPSLLYFPRYNAVILPAMRRRPL